MHENVNQDASIPEGDYYVTVRDAGRTGFLLGPYSDLRDALANVKRAKDLACAANSRAVFYAYGTSRLPIGTTVLTVFNEKGKVNERHEHRTEDQSTYC